MTTSKRSSRRSTSTTVHRRTQWRRRSTRRSRGLRQGCAPRLDKLYEKAKRPTSAQRFRSHLDSQPQACGSAPRRRSTDPVVGRHRLRLDEAVRNAPRCTPSLFFPDQMTREVVAFGNRYGKRIAALFAKPCDGRHVSSHADWRLDNLFLAPSGDIVAVDWQLADRSVGRRDLAYFVTQRVNVDDPAGYQHLFDTYLPELAALGIEPDRTWEMYRYATAFGSVCRVVAAGALEVNDTHHLELRDPDAPLRVGDRRARRLRPFVRNRRARSEKVRDRGATALHLGDDAGGGGRGAGSHHHDADEKTAASHPNGAFPVSLPASSSRPATRARTLAR